MIAHALTTTSVRSLFADISAAGRTYLAGSRIIPFIIVSVFAGVMSSAEYMTVEYTMTEIFGEPPDWMDALMVLQWIASYTMQLILWVVCAAVAHFMAVIFDGKGKFADLFFIWGFGYLPLALAACVVYATIASSLGAFAEMASATAPQYDSIPGMNILKLFSQLGVVLLGAWGAWCVSRIHHLSAMQSFLCLALPLCSFVLLRLLFLQLF